MEDTLVGVRWVVATQTSDTNRTPAGASFPRGQTRLRETINAARAVNNKWDVRRRATPNSFSRTQGEI